MQSDKGADAMAIRDEVGAAVKDAMRAKDAARLSTLRMIGAAIKDRDIALRGEGAEGPATEADLMALLGKMIKQRQESARAYAAGGRAELAAKEEAEIAVIEGFLPRQLTGDEVEAAIAAAIAATGAASIRDMGRVMADLRARHAGQMDFGAAGALVKARLG
jgi:hypothetical protein